MTGIGSGVTRPGSGKLVTGLLDVLMLMLSRLLSLIQRPVRVAARVEPPQKRLRQHCQSSHAARLCRTAKRDADRIGGLRRQRQHQHQHQQPD